VNGSMSVQVLDLACGVFLLAAVGALWRRELPAVIGFLAVQGAALAVIAAALGADEHHPELYAVAAGVGVLRAGVLPGLARRALAASGEDRESQPLVNVAASLLVAAVLVLLAYTVAAPLARLE